MSDEQTTQTEAVTPAPEPVIVDLKMSVEQVNLVLNLLSQLPFKDSAGLINSIRNQAISQLQNRQAVAEETPAPEVLQ